MTLIFKLIPCIQLVNVTQKWSKQDFYLPKMSQINVYVPKKKNCKRKTDNATGLDVDMIKLRYDLPKRTSVTC